MPPRRPDSRSTSHGEDDPVPGDPVSYRSTSRREGAKWPIQQRLLQRFRHTRCYENSPRSFNLARARRGIGAFCPSRRSAEATTGNREENENRSSVKLYSTNWHVDDSGARPSRETERTKNKEPHRRSQCLFCINASPFSLPHPRDRTKGHLCHARIGSHRLLPRPENFHANSMSRK